jgi:hypothetical protein
VPRRRDLGDPHAGLLQVDLVGEQPGDQVVDPGEVVEVGLAVGHVAGHRHRRIVERGLVADVDGRERHVDDDLPQPEVVRDRRHRGGDVGRARTVGQQHLADPQAEVERPVRLARSRHTHHHGGRRVRAQPGRPLAA